MEQRVIVVSQLNDSTQDRANREIQKLGIGWKVILANTTCTVFNVGGGREVWNATTIVVERIQTLSDADANELKKKLALTVASLDLSVRATTALGKAQINTVEQLVTKHAHELSGMRNFGMTSLQEVKRKLEDMGLSLGMAL